ncbi:MAG: LpxL/LpxP family acyltransferase, partial [Candidatus Limnocylindria bacterium]
MATEAPAAPRPATRARPSGPQAERKRELLTYWLYRTAERFINALPRGLVLPAAAAVGNVAYDLGGPKRQLLHENLSRPLRLPEDDRRVRRAARRAFRNYAKYLVDMMRIGELEDAEARRLVQIENPELLDEAR